MTDNVVQLSQPDRKRPCVHEEFAVLADVNRMADSADEDGVPQAYMLELHVECSQCGEPFRFPPSIEPGLLWDQPSRSPNADELRVPIRPESQQGDMYLPAGFTIRMVDGD